MKLVLEQDSPSNGLPQKQQISTGLPSNPMYGHLVFYLQKLSPMGVFLIQVCHL